MQAAGFALDSSLSGTTQTFESLFQLLDQGIPVDAMEGQANSIQGIRVRMETAFRGIGEAILGVDKDTGQFLEGGAGARLVQFFKDLPAILGQESVQESMKNLGNSLADFVETALPKIVKLIEFLGNNAEAIIKITGFMLVFGGTLSYVGGVLETVGTLIEGAGYLIDGFGFVIKKMPALIGAFSTALSFLAAHPIILAVIALVAAIAALWVWWDKIPGVVKIVLAAFAPFIVIPIAIIKNWDKVKGWFSTFWGFLVGVWNKIVEGVTTAFNAIKTVWDTVLFPVLKFIVSYWLYIFNFMKNVLIIIFGTILIVILTILNRIKDIIVAGVTFWWKIFSTILGFIFEGVKTTFTAVWNFITTIWNAIFEVISGIVQRIIDFFAPAFSWLFDKGKAIVQGLVDGIKAVASAVWQAVKFVADQIGNFFSGAWNWLYDTGRAIIEGLINGIKAMVGKVGEVAGNVASEVKNKFKDLLSIRSPSKVFRGFGIDIAQGLVRGLTAGRSLVEGAVEGLSMSATGVASGPVTGEVSGGSVNVQINMSGIMTRSRSDLREISKDMIRSVNEELQARNQPVIGGGNL